MTIKSNNIGHFCDLHIPWIALLPHMKRFGVECGIEEESKSTLLEKSHFSRFRLKEHGLRQREIEALIYGVNWVYHTWLES